MAKVVLGKGLGALINTPKPPSLEPGDRVERIALAEIVPSPLQPRKDFRSDQLARLGLSPSDKAVVQPAPPSKPKLNHEVTRLENRLREKSATHVTIHQQKNRVRF